jgi:hypothetical protein
MDEKVRSSWSLKAVQAGIAPQAASPLGLGAIAALPVLPSAFSTANAEPRRQAEPEKHDPVPGVDEFAATKPVAAAPVVKPMQGAPALASDAQALAQAPVRISDLAPAQAEKDAPACRAGDQTSTDPRQAAPPGEQDRTGTERPGTPETPLPHCIIEFDPDADDGDVIAHAPAPQTVQVAAKSASAVTQDEKAQTADAASQPATSEGEAAPAGATATAGKGNSPGGTPASDEAISQAQATPTLDEVQLAVTEATRGVGTAVIDPLVPLDSVMFGGDQSLLALAEAPLPVPTTPDPVAESLAALGTGPEPDLFPGLGRDLVFFT